MFNYNKYQLKNLEKVATEILMLENKYKYISDFELKGKIYEFRKRLSSGSNLDDILIESFATCREATWRVLRKRQYKTQVIGGIALHQGRIAEMKTGEGKTITELCPAYLNAISGQGVHIVSVNEYLAKRDFDEMKSVFEFLGLSVGLVLEGTINKKEEYSKDIIYSTNVEIGFDYLRDNTIYDLNDKVQRQLNYIIIDEVDSVLIDEAQTPLVLSTPLGESTVLYEQIIPIIKTFNEDVEYEYDKKESSITFTDLGYKILEEKLSVDLLDIKNSDVMHYLNQCLKAEKIMLKGKDYIVDKNEIILVDQNTGRLAIGKRFSDGLHQAIEAKEGVDIKAESTTLASITYPNLFELYRKVSGMSGTVKIEENELKEIYNLDVVVVPTNRPIKRIDNEDIIVKTYTEKIKLIIDDIKRTNLIGQPILVCSQSIKQSIEISRYLQSEGIKHNLLNGYSKVDEAQIISRAGEIGTITVSTNIAGRGTDIKVSKEALKLGGLKVIGTERSFSKRVDNQLIGRAGRRGDQGVSQFYISLEDEIYHKYSSERFKDFVFHSKSNKDILKSKKVKKSVVQLQNICHDILYCNRREEVKYNQVMNLQRKVIYDERNKFLTMNNSSDIANLLKFLSESIYNYIGEIIDLNSKNEGEEILITSTIFEKLSLKFNFKSDYFEFYDDLIGEYHKKDEFQIELANHIISDANEVLANYDEAESKKYIIYKMLLVIDMCWIEQLKQLELDKIKVKNEMYNQKDPALIFKTKALNSFNNMKENILNLFMEEWFARGVSEVINSEI